MLYCNFFVNLWLYNTFRFDCYLSFGYDAFVVNLWYKYSICLGNVQKINFKSNSTPSVLTDISPSRRGRCDVFVKL